MKKLLYVILPFALLGCMQEAEVLHVKSSDNRTIESDKGYVFENDSAKVVYDFWQKNGMMSFAFYNKTAAPLYIDWMKSSFIRANERITYYQDVVNTKSSSHSRAGNGYFNTIVSGTNTNATSVREERVSFVPPYSGIVKIFTGLTNGDYIRLPKKPFVKGEHSIQSMSIDRGETPIYFRNFITYSPSENFSHEQYIDNGFYVDSVLITGYEFMNSHPRVFESPASFYTIISSNSYEM